MLCGICQTSLDGTSDPTKTTRLARVTHSESPASQHLEIENYVYAHHHTLESITKSSQQGCDVCTLISWDYRLGTIKTHDTACNYDYFSTFRISVERENLVMYTRCLDFPEYDSVFVPVAKDDEESNVQYEVDSSTDSPRTWKLLERWIDDCNIHHDCITDYDRFLPTRLIRIDRTQTPPSYNVVLREECPPNSKYVALSYIWGDQPVGKTFRLLSSNIDQLRSPNSIELLPRTFQDAIRVTERLQVEYLWIDRLCIIQDSEADWRSEAGNMHNVYKNSVLTVSALSSLNDSSGLFFERNAEQIAPTVVRLQATNTDQLVPFRHDGENCRTYSILWHKEAETVKRGWCYQERVLSPRVVHFGRSQIYWECWQRNACEMHPNQAGGAITRSHFKRLLGGPTPAIAEDPYVALLQNWYIMVQMYSNTKLTYQSDRLIALAGLVNDVKAMLVQLRPDIPHPYLAGLWSEDLRFGLCWERFIFGQDQFQNRPLHSNIPSWSWACGNFGGSYSNRNSVRDWFIEESDCRVSAEYRGGDDAADVTSAILHITGPWMAMKVLLQGEVPLRRRYNARLVRYIRRPGEDEKLETQFLESESEVAFDFTDDMPENILCVPILTSHRSATNTFVLETLCLVRANRGGEGDDLYRRVGSACLRYTCIDPIHELVSKCQKITIQVI